MTPPQPLIAMRGIARKFGTVEALRGVDLACAAGEIHALLGENGAGKSTLMHVLFGMVAPDAGAIAIDGRPVRIGSPGEAMRHGLGMVHQHFTQVARLTVAENVWLGRSGLRFDRDAACRNVVRVAAETGLALDPWAEAGSLSIGLRQRLEIVKALSRDNVRALILDEPTAALAPPEVHDLFAALRRLAAGGTAVILISHKLREVTALANRVTVLRAGEAVLSGRAEEYDAAALAHAMIGPGAKTADLDATFERPLEPVAATGKPVALSVRDLVGAGGRHDAARVSFDVHRGEIVGVAAVEGNGQRELLRAVAGLEHGGGTVSVAEGGAAFIPEDRHAEGLVLDFTVAENLLLGRLRGLTIERSRLTSEAAALIEEFDIRPGDPAAIVRGLSGGNQQKVVLARAFAKQPALLVAENPTRGLDVHATAQVYAMLRRAARERGMGVLLYSSDLDEVLRVADRVAVMVDGRWRWVADGERSRETVGAMMVGRAA